MLHSALNEISDGKKVTKALLIILDDDNCYDIGYRNSGLNCTDAIALMRVTETKFLNDMGYLEQ